MSAWFGSSTPRVAQDPQPPPESDAPTHPNEPAWELVESIEARVKRHDADKPFVTLSWAQGLDGSMAHAREDDPRLMLSGKASMALTHGLRKAHAAIMVGRGTIQGDDPRLSVRMDVDGKDITLEAQPTAVILDGSLSTPPSSKIVSQAQMRRVIILTRGDSEGMCDFQEKPPKSWSMAKIQRGAALSCRGAKVMCLRSTSLQDILEALKTLGISSAFVEGGVSVVDAFLRRPDLIDHVVVTVAPLFVGGRRPPSGPLRAPLRLSHVETLCLADDVVVSGQMPSAVDFANVAPEFAHGDLSDVTHDSEDDDEVTEFERLSQKHADAKRLKEERAERDRLAKEHGLAPDDRLITQAIEEARALDET